VKRKEHGTSRILEEDFNLTVVITRSLASCAKKKMFPSGSYWQWKQLSGKHQENKHAERT
jgi:hypothetical protein